MIIARELGLERLTVHREMIVIVQVFERSTIKSGFRVIILLKGV